MRRTLATLAAFIRRDWATAVSYRVPFVLELVTMLFSLVMFFYLGRVVDDSALSAKAGLQTSYFAFAVIGLALLSIVHTGLTSFGQKMREEQTTGTFEALMATPAPPALLVLGSAAYDLLRATVSGLVLIGLALAIFGVNFDTDPASVAFALLALAGSVALFAALGVAVAAFTVVFKQAAVAIGLATNALAVLGGVYFPVGVLPEPLRTIGQALPFTWALDVMRSALLSGERDVGLLALLVASAAVLMPAALVLFNRALQRARRAGTLAQY